MQACLYLDPSLGPYFLLSNYKTIPQSSPTWGRVIKTLACCDPPLPGKEIKLFFFSFTQNSVSAFQFSTRRQRLNSGNSYLQKREKQLINSLLGLQPLPPLPDFHAFLTLNCARSSQEPRSNSPQALDHQASRQRPNL